MGALCAAAFPTWDLWRARFEESQFFSCLGSLPRYHSAWERLLLPFLLPLRGDLNALHSFAMTWAAPAIVVLVCFAHWHSAVAGRRAAGILTLLAVLGPLTWPYFDSACCATVPVLSAQWWTEMIDSWGTTEVSLLAAAVLVLLATQVLGPAEESPAATVGLVARRSAAFLIDYWLVAVCVTLIAQPFPDFLEYGLGDWLRFDKILEEPLRLLLPAALILYVLPRRTLGIWLTGDRRPVGTEPTGSA
jgi:hypothetical protein